MKIQFLYTKHTKDCTSFKAMKAFNGCKPVNSAPAGALAKTAQ
jgi:hypothetical protein